MSLLNKRILITGAAKRIGRYLALDLARSGADIIIHHAHSPNEAAILAEEIKKMGRQAMVIEADFNEPENLNKIMDIAWGTGLYGLINNASIFENLSWKQTTLYDWQKHINVNLTAPFILSKAFAEKIIPPERGRIVNLLDWRALRPGSDHFPYTVSKAGLAALTKSMAAAFAPSISVNGLALGAILPPSDGGEGLKIIEDVPARRWADLEEVGEVVRFLLDGPDYITGEIIHLDGGRHLI